MWRKVFVWDNCFSNNSYYDWTMASLSSLLGYLIQNYWQTHLLEYYPVPCTEVVRYLKQLTELKKHVGGQCLICFFKKKCEL